MQVFRNVKQVLPQFIIDFAIVTGELSNNRVSIAEQKRRLEELERGKLLELQRDSIDIKEKEKTFKEEYNQRYLDAHSLYINFLNNLKVELQNLPESKDEMKQKVLWLSRRLETETNQFCNLSPIYMGKSSLIQTIKQNNVVIVSAATGSGKSTQLPQYILDDVFESTETRRVAVLEPRRFNAIGLCNRVSRERSENMGMEVGYSLGQGDLCTSIGTRIEFMTHGLFINRALKTENIVRTYGAVVLDEAHERSVDVDFCFALLRRALLFAARDCRSFKVRLYQSLRENKYVLSYLITFLRQVIVASATLSSDQLERYKRFLAPNQSPSNSCIYKVRGNSYPIKIIYRPEAEPNWDEANSMETAAALSSYAVEIALNLIRSSESDGNILVFLPGESVIDTCISKISECSALKNDHNTTLTSHDGCQSIQLRSTLKNGEESVVNIGLYAFHGKVSDMARKAMENHEGQDRIIIFSTNVAETGLTLPNIRYVIDTGLERRVVWNNVTCTREMRTVRITKSSMEQRAGRAGRVASGICVRLYSKETADQLGEKGSEIESGMILRAVLLKISIEEKSSEKLEMIEEIPQESLDSAQDILRNIGALDDNNAVTDMGRKLMSLGVDLRLGRFILACVANGVLRSGSDLVAIVSSTNSLSLLPTKDMPYSGTQFLHESGDHLTLLNIFMGYEKASSKTEFCVSYSFDISILEAASRSRESISNALSKMKLTDADSESNDDESNRSTKLLISLCSAYFDQVLSSNSPGAPNAGFIRVISGKDRKNQREASAQVAAFGGLAYASTDDDTIWDDDDEDSNVSDITLPTGVDTIASNSSVNLKSNLNNYDRVSIPKNSSLWLLQAGQSDCGQRLAVFHSLMLTDSRRGMVAHLISYVRNEYIQEGASDWYDKSKFASIAENLAVVKKSFKVSDYLAKFLVRGNLMNKHFNKYMRVKAFVNKLEKTLEVTAPPFVLAQIERKLWHLENENEEELIHIVINNLSDRKTAALIKFFGRGNVEYAEEKKSFVNCLNRKIKCSLGAAEGFVDIHPNEIGIAKDKGESGSCTIDVRLHGSSKQFASLVIGEIQSVVVSQLTVMTEIVYNNLANNQIGTLVNRLGKNSDHKNDFVQRLDVVLKGQGCETKFDSSNIGVQSNQQINGQCTINIKLRDHLKYAVLIISEIKNEVQRVLTVPAEPTVVDNNGLYYPTVQTQDESKLKFNKYLAQLSTSSPPPPSSVTDRNLEMTYIAHAAIWIGKCSVYGGFIRDLLINSTAPNDIDISFEPDKMDVMKLKQILVYAANSINVQLISENPNKGMVYSIQFRGRGNPFEVDLANAAKVRTSSEAPGVDCDVGNMVVEVSGQDTFGMTLKVKDRLSLLPLAVCQKHCREKKFVFYYKMDSDSSRRRLDKYFKRGWICLSKFEEPMLSWAKSNGYETLLQPKREYSLPYHKLP